MAKYLFISMLLLSIIFSTDNEKLGRITYTVSLEKDSLKTKKLDLNEATFRMIKLNDEATDVEFTLEFVGEKSIYRTGEYHFYENQEAINVTKIMAGGNNVYYHDSTQDSIFMKTNMSDENFIVSKPKIEWKILDETKTIEGHICQKAVPAKSNRRLIAWFAPEIPVSHGPKDYNGLPGLILELIDGPFIYKANSVQLGLNDFEIKKPTDGISLTFEQYKKRFGAVLRE